MATIDHTCARCRKTSRAFVRQQTKGWRVAWSMSFQCSTCGDAFESDGDEAPEDVRDAIIAEEGIWGLIVEATGTQRVKAIHSLRTGLNLSMEEASRLKGQIPGMLLRGTRIEMAHAQGLLAERGISCRIERVG